MADEAAALRILLGVRRVNGSPRPTLEAIEKVHDRHPDLQMETVARELEFWATHGNGARKKIKSVMGTFATFAKRTQEDRDRASASHSAGTSVPSGGEYEYPDGEQGWGRQDF